MKNRLVVLTCFMGLLSLIRPVVISAQLTVEDLGVFLEMLIDNAMDEPRASFETDYVLAGKAYIYMPDGCESYSFLGKHYVLYDGDGLFASTLYDMKYDYFVTSKQFNPRNYFLKWGKELGYGDLSSDIQCYTNKKYGTELYYVSMSSLFSNNVFGLYFDKNNNFAMVMQVEDTMSSEFDNEKVSYVSAGELMMKATHPL